MSAAVPLDFVPRNERELEMCLSDPMWRLGSGYLYKIMIKEDDDDDGADALVVPFKPNRAQRRLLAKLHYRNIILKARQLGFTTLIAIYFLDCSLFRANVRAGIIAHEEAAAKAIFRDKVKFAYENLPPELLEAMPLKRDSAEELLFVHNNSSIRVSTSMRSGTMHYLHVSEFGKICAKFPDRAHEVVTGSIPTVPLHGQLFIESTAEGREGEFFKMCQKAEKNLQSGKRLTPKEYRFHFFPWWGQMEYRMDPDDVIITSKDDEYFDKIEADEGCEIDIEQRAWWVSTRDNDFSGAEEKMWQEYPSTSSEAFQRSTEGCYYSVQMTAARKQGRITKVPYLPGYPVNTFWDIGNSDGTAIWFHQRVGQQDRFINFIEGWGEPYAYYVKKMQDLGYTWGKHYLPHDGNHERQGENANLAPREQLHNLGLRHIEVVDRVAELQHGIQATRNAFSTCWFDETECKEGLAHLDLYRKSWNQRMACFSDTPQKDIHTEAADAFRQFAQAGLDLQLGTEGRRPKRKNKGGMAA